MKKYLAAFLLVLLAASALFAEDRTLSLKLTQDVDNQYGFGTSEIKSFNDDISNEDQDTTLATESSASGSFEVGYYFNYKSYATSGFSMTISATRFSSKNTDDTFGYSIIFGGVETEVADSADATTLKMQSGATENTNVSQSTTPLVSFSENKMTVDGSHASYGSIPFGTVTFKSDQNGIYPYEQVASGDYTASIVVDVQSAD